MRLRATANDRVLNNVTLIPLDVAKPAKVVLARGPPPDGDGRGRRQADAHDGVGPAAVG